MRGEPITILLVEDEPAYAAIVRRVFETMPIATSLKHISNGEAALDYLYRNNEFSDPVLHTIPVVVLSTSAADTDIAMAYRANANSYLVKPDDCSQFSDLLETLGNYWLKWNRQPAVRDR